MSPSSTPTGGFAWKSFISFCSRRVYIGLGGVGERIIRGQSRRKSRRKKEEKKKGWLVLLFLFANTSDLCVSIIIEVVKGKGTEEVPSSLVELVVELDPIKKCLDKERKGRRTE